jgi:Holliday junction resolvase RusA-like endonuclease
MSAPFTFDELVRGMVRQHVPRALAESRAAAIVAGRTGKKDLQVHLVSEASASRVEIVGPVLAYPIRLTLPWSHLVSDNRKYGATIRGGKPKLLITEEYRAAKAATQKKAREAMTVDGHRFDPIGKPLAFTGRVFVPDARTHDVCNFAKCCLDSLEKIVVANDRWFYEVHWMRAGVDVDAPRAEIEVRPIA